MIIKALSLKKFKILGVTLSSVFQSTSFAILFLSFLSLIDKKSILNFNRLLIFFSIVVLIFLYVFLGTYSTENQVALIPYFKTMVFWLLPLFFFSIGSSDISKERYKRLLSLLLIIVIVEFFLINFTTVSYFEEDRLRGKIFDLVRSQGVAHNSSMSAAISLAIYMKILSMEGKIIKNQLVQLFGTILFLSSGTGMLLTIIFLGAHFLKKNKYFWLFITTSIFFIFSLFPTIYVSEKLTDIHPKISMNYIKYIFEEKLDRIERFEELSATSENYHEVIKTFSIEEKLFGEALYLGKVITSHDFGYWTLYKAIGIIPATIIILGYLYMFYCSVKEKNLIPFSIFLIASIHYPIFVDPLAAYLMAQFTLSAPKND